MSKIIFDSGISLDGYFAGDNRSPQNPMGGASGKLHQWMFKQKAFWKHIKMEGGQEDGTEGTLIDSDTVRTYHAFEVQADEEVIHSATLSPKSKRFSTIRLRMPICPQ